MLKSLPTSCFLLSCFTRNNIIRKDISNYGGHRMKGVFSIKAKLSEAKFVYLTHLIEYCPRT